MAGTSNSSGVFSLHNDTLRMLRLLLNAKIRRTPCYLKSVLNPNDLLCRTFHALGLDLRRFIPQKSCEDVWPRPGFCARYQGSIFDFEASISLRSRTDVMQCSCFCVAHLHLLH